MELQTKVDIVAPGWKINPADRLLFVGSCFADNIGQRFVCERFAAEVNPFGVMYNPVSILHTVSRLMSDGRRFDVAVLTLGTNHVYREKSTGEIVDNCQKRPANLFHEEELTVDDCEAALREVVQLLDCKVIITVSPIRYRKYGYHGSQLSKATLLLAADRLAKEHPASVAYFPAYELMNDELRDYRFYKPDMLHPSEQAVDYIFDCFGETFFSTETQKYLERWRPIKEALAHRPLNPDSDDYKTFRKKVMERLAEFEKQYPQNSEKNIK